MLPGFKGHLVSEQFLERQVESALPRGVPRGWSRSLSLCRDEQRWMGPASSIRTMVDACAAPLARVLGFDELDGITVADDVATAVLRSGHGSAGLVVTLWGERLDPLWRVGVLHARSRGSAWCVSVNGTHVRLTSARRLTSRRFAE